MKKLLALTLLLGTALPSYAAPDEATAMAVAKKNGCLACHALDKKLVGPAWNEVGKKYGAEAGAAEQLVVKVKKGSKGVWGPVPMPPNATVKDADIKLLVDYVLTLK